MAALRKFKKLILSASFSGMQSASSAASTENAPIDLPLKRAAVEVVEKIMAAATEPNGRLFMAVAVGFFLLVLTVSLVGYSLMISSAADDTTAKQEETPAADTTVQVEKPETKVLDEPSLASETDEAPKLRRSARIRAKAAQTSKKDL